MALGIHNAYCFQKLQDKINDKYRSVPDMYICSLTKKRQNNLKTVNIKYKKPLSKVINTHSCKGKPSEKTLHVTENNREGTLLKVPAKPTVCKCEIQCIIIKLLPSEIW